MDKRTSEQHYPFFVRATHLLVSSYILYTGNANAKSQDDFYRPALYRENYILPYHISKKKPEPRVVTMARAFPPVGLSREESRSPENNGGNNSVGEMLHAQGLSLQTTQGKPVHRRNLSKGAGDPDRKGVFITPEELERLVDFPLIQTPLSPEATRGLHGLERSKTLVLHANEEIERTKAALEGRLEREGGFKERRNIRNELKEIEKGAQALIKEVFELYRFNFMKPYEVAFQVSFKVPIWRIASTDTHFYAAYSQQSWWQCYTGRSAFFRESSYMPEFFIEQLFRVQPTSGPQVESIQLGLVHQSNGMGLLLEASWNRLFSEIRFRWGPFRLVLEPWFVLNSKDLRRYNKDIAEYLGYGRACLNFEYKRYKCVFRIQRKSYQFLNSISLSPSLNITFFYFHGCGLSLATYKQTNTSWGIGIGAKV